MRREEMVWVGNKGKGVGMVLRRGVFRDSVVALVRVINRDDRRRYQGIGCVNKAR